ncbi:CDP-alcohol phosphatidyltransferase family protein [Microtetraspora sp. NBRC 13810]|uniref:CDP-alcohol phosphatidyltransferase family protein n=1 Tax=Microtetraspora sp. NBRC 13810 TaxID=3030990 RepID=UPI00255211D6|nr:CDP-alcohol phosphatidyltransferase family protein [Microtetraspora sp. NBRC 13810]
MTTYSLADVRAVCKSRDAWWTVLLVDPMACRLVRFLASRTSVTPNQVTAVAFMFGVCAAACFSIGEWRFMALGAVFFHLGFVADCIDGKLARLKRNGTVFGLWLDFALDQVRLVMCSFALAYGLYLQTGRPEAAFLAGVIIAFDLVRYLNGPHMAKVRKAMKERLVVALNVAGDTRGGRVRPSAKEKAEVRDRIRENPSTREEAQRGLQTGFQARFPWYLRMRQRLLARRIRTHLVSGIEYQMAVFVVGPILGPAALPYVVGVFGTLLMVFESALVYKLWMSTRDFNRAMRRIESREESRAGAPLVR